MKKDKITILTSVILFCCVASSALAQTTLAQQLTGEWRNHYLKIKLHNAKSDRVIEMEADTSNWEAKLQIKPIRTHFIKDGTYYSEYRNLKDSIFRKVAGSWAITKGDTLVMTQTQPSPSVLKLYLKIDNQLATFSGMIDFDGEGITNDEYYGVQKKFK
jgi:hypothetical protein